ncbi:MAG: biotin transporter BioY [Candidatus Krumholzibacteria bacterium]|nr:biotin transporter BioY [Candidatus Krumholzibacteria bacterium]
MAGSLRRVAGIAAFVGFTAVAAQLAVRLPYTPVPVTMQTLFVLLAGIVLGPRDGFYAMIAYIGIGIAGAPVFAGMTFGPAVLFGPTGGYLLAFPAAAMLTGVLTRTLGGRKPAAAVASLAGSATILLGGTLYLWLLSGQSLSGVLAMAVMPFILADLVKVAVAAVLSGR